MIDFPELTLIVPTHNRAELLLKTIESAFSQTRAFKQVIVIDDASTDDTVLLLEKFGSRVVFVTAEKIGVQRARNLGVSMANTEYVTLCDDDDILEPDFVEQVSNCLHRNPDLDSVYMNYRSFNELRTDADIVSRAPEGYFDGSALKDEFFHNIPDLYVKTVDFQPLMPSGATFTKHFYERIGGFDPNFNGVPSEDWEYTLRAIAEGRTAMSKQPLVMIRRHLGNDSADLMRQAVGEVEVLEYALLHHRIAARSRQQLMSGIDRRREEIFYEAFRRRNFAVAGAIFPLLPRKSRTFKFKLKSLFLIMHSLFHRYDIYKSLNFSAPIK